ncbi:hypothetical protein cypCar_00011715 [Cyprinus carpio]|nr:hypothetical protein cypCar_00011715 [Cyprinus carpio]
MLSPELSADSGCIRKLNNAAFRGRIPSADDFGGSHGCRQGAEREAAVFWDVWEALVSLLCLYCYCGTHCVNLIAQAACVAGPVIRDTLGLVHELGSFFNQSVKFKPIFKIIVKSQHSFISVDCSDICYSCNSQTVRICVDCFGGNGILWHNRYIN